MKDTISFKCKPILIPTQGKSRIYKSKDKFIFISSDNNDNVQEHGYDLYLISSLPGDDITMGDLFIRVPHYDTMYISTDKSETTKANEIPCTNIKPFINKSNQKKFIGLGLTQNIPKEDTRKIIAGSDEISTFNLPKLKNELIKKITDSINKNKKIYPEVVFDIINIKSGKDEGQYLIPQQDENGYIVIIEKTQEEIKAEDEAIKLWNERISPYLSVTTKCNNYKVLSGFIDEYVKNYKTLTEKGTQEIPPEAPPGCVKIGQATVSTKENKSTNKK